MKYKTPLCKCCGKKLAREINLVFRPADEPEPTLLWDKYTIVEILSKKPDNLQTNQTEYRVWCGHYGYNGNDNFCTMRCGYRYALAMIKAQR